MINTQQCINILMHQYLICSIDTHYVLRYIDASQYCPISTRHCCCSLEQGTLLPPPPPPTGLLCSLFVSVCCADCLLSPSFVCCDSSDFSGGAPRTLGEIRGKTVKIKHTTWMYCVVLEKCICKKLLQLLYCAIRTYIIVSLIRCLRYVVQHSFSRSMNFVTSESCEIDSIKMIPFFNGSDNCSVNFIFTNLYAKFIRIVELKFWLVHLSDKIIKCQMSAAVVLYSIAVYHIAGKFGGEKVWRIWRIVCDLPN